MASHDPIKEFKKVALVMGAILLAGLGIILSFLIPQIGASRRQAEQGFAISNAKRVAAALLAYASDYGVLPTAEVYGDGSFAPSLSPADYLVRPNDSETFSLNVALAGRPFPEAGDVKILIFTGPGDWPLQALDLDKATGDQPCFAKTDGSVDCVPSAEFTSLAGR